MSGNGDIHRRMGFTVRIWLEVAHHEAFGVGGWAFVRLDDGVVSGGAGGERRVDLERTSLAALAAALAKPPPGARIEVLTASPAVLAIPARIAAAEAGRNPPMVNLDLWAQVSTSLHRLRPVIGRAEPVAGAPTTFAAAWADLARDRAKDKGAFTALIPRSNLAKAGV